MNQHKEVENRRRAARKRRDSEEKDDEEEIEEIDVNGRQLAVGGEEIVAM